MAILCPKPKKIVFFRRTSSNADVDFLRVKPISLNENIFFAKDVDKVTNSCTAGTSAASTSTAVFDNKSDLVGAVCYFIGK